MEKAITPIGLLRTWAEIPTAIENAIDGLDEAALDLRGGSSGMSVREIVHHLAEANLVAASIVIAGMGASGSTYDWSWMYPNVAWAKRMGYSTAPVRPAIETLKALSGYFSILLDDEEKLSRQVNLLNSPGSELQSTTVKDVILQEIEHAHMHLRDIAEIRTRHSR